jgi:NADH:ubiquinone oxidoreductase subunit 5 (subunit L)/multisubunit Na+/H+ antiporter MnhA subunit
MPYLTLSILIPIVAGVLVLALAREDRAALVKRIALIGALAGFAITIPLYTQFNLASGGMQFEELARWIESYNINYHLGVDGISVLFVLLNSFTTILVVISAWVVIDQRPAQYYAAFLIQSGLINGVFCALDAVLFYFFFEAMLIPMYLIIGAMTIGPMLFGDFFKGAIVVLENHDVLAEVGKEYHGPVAMALHGLTQPPFWLALAGVALAWFLYLKRPDLPDLIAERTMGLYKLLDN